MAYQLSVDVRNAELDAIEVAIGPDPIMRLFTGPQPANCAAADSGTVLNTLVLPADWMSAAAAGAKTLLGSWVDASADNAGTFGHFRIYESTGVTCKMQGSAGTSGTQMIVSSASIGAGESFTVTGFTMTAGNA